MPTFAGVYRNALRPKLMGAAATLSVVACSASEPGSRSAQGGAAQQGGNSMGTDAGRPNASSGGSLASSGGSFALGGVAGAALGGTSAGGAAGSLSGGVVGRGGAAALGGASSGSGGARAAGGAATGGARQAGGAAGASVGGSSASGGVPTSGGAGTCPAPAPGSKGQNPLFSDVYTADPAPFVHDCTFYVHCGHDEGNGKSFTMFEWYVLKSTDMVHWTRTVGMRYTVFSWAHGNAWAGQLVTKNGKFYWYVPVEQGNGNGQMAIGVAVADSPEGPFRDAIGKPLVDDAFERQNMGFASDGDTPYTIDPTVFVDDDGQAYLHYGGFSRLVNAKLGDDMISISGKMKESTPSCYFEAPFLTKRNGMYYEIYACGVNPPTIDYATSSSPLGPWTHRGTVLPKMVTLSGQDAATNHAGVAQRGDQWYVVYHVSNGPNGGGTYHREVAVDKLNFNSDGTIQQVTPSAGLSF